MIIIIIILNLKMQRENPLVSALNIYSTYMYFLLNAKVAFIYHCDIQST